jgi:hypothetical protein
MEIDRSLTKTAYRALRDARDFANAYSRERLRRHLEFVSKRLAETGPLKHVNRHYGFPVVTSQERDLLIRDVERADMEAAGTVTATYAEGPQTGLVVK